MLSRVAAVAVLLLAVVPAVAQQQSCEALASQVAALRTQVAILMASMAAEREAISGLAAGASSVAEDRGRTVDALFLIGAELAAIERAVLGLPVSTPTKTPTKEKTPTPVSTVVVGPTPTKTRTPCVVVIGGATFPCS